MPSADTVAHTVPALEGDMYVVLVGTLCAFLAVALSTNHPQLLRSDWYHSDMPQVLYLDIRINWLRMFISKCQDMPDSSRFDKLVETSKNEIDVYERERQRR